MLDFWIYLMYSDTPIDGATGSLGESIINQVYYAHRASTYKGYVKRCAMVAPGWIDANPTAWASWLATEMADRDYMRIKGLPVLGIFDPVTTNGNSTHKTAWLALVAAIPFPVYKIGFGAVNTTAWTGLGLNGGTNYDGGLAAAPLPNGQHSWADQVTKDLSSAGQAGFDVIETVSLRQDNRPRKGEAGTGWSDYPTIPDAISALQNVASFKPTVLMVSPETEIDESGGLGPRVQDLLENAGGVLVRAGRDYDTILWARDPSQKPGSTSYVIDARELYWARTGWAGRTTGVDNAHDGDYLTTSTPGDSISLTCNASILGSGTTGTLEIMCPVNFSYGTIDVLKNGVSQGTVNLATGSAQFQSVKTVAVSLGDVVAVTAVSGTVALDGARVTHVP